MPENESILLNTFIESKFYKIFTWIGALVCLALIFWRGSLIVTSPEWLSIDDYVEYWAAGQLNLHEGNPYNPDQLLPLQHMAGRYFGVPVMMWNPPWMLALVMPFSIFEYSISRILWILFFIFIVFISASISWSLYGGKPETKWMSWILAFTFVPILGAFRTGQTGPLLLLGVVGFLFFLKKDKPLLAGVSISLLAIKPHILYLYLFSILVWCIHKRQWKVIIGTGITLVSATFAALIVNTNVIQQYLAALANFPTADWVPPTLGGITRLLIGPEKFWVQFVPLIFGLIWFSIYWIRKRNQWDWIELSPILILVSIVTAAYGWTTDQSVSLIAIIQVFILLLPFTLSFAHLFVIIAYMVIEILMIVPLGHQIYLWWLASALLIWYLVSNTLSRNYHKPNR